MLIFLEMTISQCDVYMAPLLCSSLIMLYKAHEKLVAQQVAGKRWDLPKIKHSREPRDNERYGKFH